MSGSRSIPRMRGWLALLCLGVQAMAHAQRGPGAALPDTAPEAILVELQVGRLASRTVPAFRVRTEVLVPVTQLLELAEIRFRLSPEGRLEARVDPGARLLVIDERRDSMEYGTHRVRIERDFRVFRDGELYVGAERMGDLLGARIVVNWNELVVTLVDPADLPIGRRARRGPRSCVAATGSARSSSWASNGIRGTDWCSTIPSSPPARRPSRGPRTPRLWGRTPSAARSSSDSRIDASTRRGPACGAIRRGSPNCEQVTDMRRDPGGVPSAVSR